MEPKDLKNSPEELNGAANEPEFVQEENAAEKSDEVLAEIEPAFAEETSDNRTDPEVVLEEGRN
jgi:hypothetical protein